MNSVCLKNSSIILAIYVDDGLMVGSNVKEINKFLKELANKFKISRNSDTYVGHEITITEEYKILTQRDYIKRLLKQSGMDNAKTVKVSILRGDDSSAKNEELSLQRNSWKSTLCIVKNKTGHSIWSELC